MGWSPTVNGGSSNPKWAHQFGYNLSNTLTKYKNAMQNYSTSRVKIHFVGDSVTNGVGSSGTFASPNAYPDQLRSVLQNRYSGNTSLGFQYPNGFGGTWTNINGGGIGLMYYKNTSAAVGDNTSIYDVNGPTITLYYCADASGGAANVTIDGAAPTGGPTSISCNNAGGFVNLSATYTGLSSSTHTIKITTTNTSPVYICGALGATGTTGIELNKLGVSGSKATDWNNTNVFSAWQNFCSDASLVCIALGYNDMSPATSSNRVSTLSGYKTAMGNIISTWQGIGASVVLIALPRTNQNYNPNGNYWPEWVQAMYSLADQYNVGLIDAFQATMQSNEFLTSIDYFTTASAASGPSGSNPVHPSDVGHTILARIIEPILVV